MEFADRLLPEHTPIHTHTHQEPYEIILQPYEELSFRRVQAKTNFSILFHIESFTSSLSGLEISLGPSPVEGKSSGPKMSKKFQIYPGSDSNTVPEALY